MPPPPSVPPLPPPPPPWLPPPPQPPLSPGGQLAHSVTWDMTLSDDLATFNKTSFVYHVAIWLQVPMSYIQVDVSSASVKLNIAVLFPAPNRTAAQVAQET
eukprot:5220054-Prymnesium_polylepis.1